MTGLPTGIPLDRVAVAAQALKVPLNEDLLWRFHCMEGEAAGLLLERAKRAAP